MFQHPNPQKVIDDLGDKFVLAFVKAVDLARTEILGDDADSVDDGS